MNKQNNTSKTAPIICEITGKLLARMDGQGLYLWCKVCKTEHRILLTGITPSLTNWQDMQSHTLPE